jgi:hypothetical protein
MLKNESARNPTKPTPLRPARLPDSGGIIFMSNGVRMEKISHSVRKVKQAKKMLTGYRTRVSPYSDTWQVRTLTRGRFRTGHVASPERDTCQADLAFWHTVGPIPKVTRVTTGRVTRGRDDVSSDVAG